MRHTLAVLALLLCGIGGAIPALSAHNGTAAGNSYTPIVFPQLSAADTLTSVNVKGLVDAVEFQMKVYSIRVGGWTAGTDSVYWNVAKSLDDSNFVNVSSSGEVKGVGAAGVSTITYDLTKPTNFVRIEVPRIAGDSVRVQLKAQPSPVER